MPFILSAISLGDANATNPSQKLLDKNFGLSEAAFNGLVFALQQGDESLFERTFLSHFESCVNFLIAQDRINHALAYDVTMDTLLNFRERLVHGKISYGNLRYLFTLMARQQLGRDQRKSARIVPLNQALGGNEPTASIDIPDEDYELLTKAFEKLGKDCKTLLRDFYYNKRKLKDIALSKEKTSTSVRKQKSRCVALLRNLYLQLCH
ncbi:MAG: hypothetical protein AAF828_02285 [Bacteroidota bacterium]